METIQVTDTRITGYLLSYDLVSERVVERFFKKLDKQTQAEEFKKAVKSFCEIKSTRASATNILHNLGMQVTQSVIIISQRRGKEEIGKAVDIVIANYQATRETVKNLLGVDIGEPKISLIPIVSTQFLFFRDQAEKTLLQKLDRQIELLQVKIEKGETYGTKAIQTKIREIEKTRKLCGELGISADDNLNLLVEMLKTAEEREA